MPAPRKMTQGQRVAYDIAKDDEKSGFECGYMAAIHGCSLNENPMAKGSGDWLAWRNGWRECSGGVAPPDALNSQ